MGREGRPVAFPDPEAAWTRRHRGIRTHELVASII